MDILTLITFSPLLGILGILLVPAHRKDAIRTLAAVTTFVPLALASWLWVQFDTSTAGYQFVERLPWIASLGVNYHMGLDGLSIPLV